MKKFIVMNRQGGGAVFCVTAPDQDKAVEAVMRGLNQSKAFLKAFASESVGRLRYNPLDDPRLVESVTAFAKGLIAAIPDSKKIEGLDEWFEYTYGSCCVDVNITMLDDGSRALAATAYPMYPDAEGKWDTETSEFVDLNV